MSTNFPRPFYSHSRGDPKRPLAFDYHNGLWFCLLAVVASNTFGPHSIESLRWPAFPVNYA